RRPDRLRRRLVRGGARRGLRVPRPERCRQDDDRTDARHAPRPDLRLADGSRSCRSRRASISDVAHDRAAERPPGSAVCAGADRRGRGGGCEVSLNTRGIRAIFRKELREYRRHTSIVISVAIFPLVFLIQPLAVALVAPGSSADTLGGHHLLLYMLAIPVLAP